MRGRDQVFLGFWLGGASVLVDQSRRGLGGVGSGCRGDHGGGVVAWWALAQTLVRAVVIEMAHVLIKNSSGVSLVVDQHPVGAFGADAADEPFRIAVGLRRPRRVLRNGVAFGSEDGIEGGGELAVPVADQEAEGADLLV